MKHRWMTTTVVGAALALAPVCAAQSPAFAADKATTDKQAKLSSSDRKFVKEALDGNMAEVALGKLAAERASNDAVKQFGQRMVSDHGKAHEELAGLAREKGMEMPADLERSHVKLRDKLSKLSGADFDRAYVNEMVRDHKKDVKDFEREASKAKDPEVKSFASKTLPTLQDHLKQIEQIQTQVKGTAKK